MERIAVINGHIYLYWSSIVMTLAAAAAVCLFLALYLGKKRRPLAALTGIPLAIFLSLVLSRLTFWYFRPDRHKRSYRLLPDLQRNNRYIA